MTATVIVGRNVTVLVNACREGHAAQYRHRPCGPSMIGHPAAECCHRRKMPMEVANPFAQLPTAPEPIIAQVRRQLADDAQHGGSIPTGVLDRVADHAVRELWGSRIKTLCAASSTSCWMPMPDANIIVLGDLNDYWFSPPLETLTTAAGARICST